MLNQAYLKGDIDIDLANYTDDTTVYPYDLETER